MGIGRRKGKGREGEKEGRLVREKVGRGRALVGEKVGVRVGRGRRRGVW